MGFVRLAGSIQFDPLDICGRNTELALHARVQGYTQQTLWDLLYRERKLVDYFDKELCIFTADDWPKFARTRAHRSTYQRSFEKIEPAIPAMLDALRTRGPASAKELNDGKTVHWYWGKTNLARATLEYLYYAGIVGIAFKQGAIKSYDLIERLLPQALVDAPDPFPDEGAFQRFLLLRRMGAIGLLWNRASSAWLGLGDFKAPQRRHAFDTLLKAGDILPVRIEGLKDTFYIRAEEAPALACIQAEAPRCEALPPLDNLLWDRKLIEAIFGFSYTWEAYTPVHKRVYGHYVLPLLYGDRFIARVEPVFDRALQKLTVRNIWPEQGIDIRQNPYRDAIAGCMDRLETLNRQEVNTDKNTSFTKKA